MILQAEVFCVSGETQQKLGNDHRRAQKCETNIADFKPFEQIRFCNRPFFPLGTVRQNSSFHHIGDKRMMERERERERERESLLAQTLRNFMKK